MHWKHDETGIRIDMDKCIDEHIVVTKVPKKELDERLLTGTEVTEFKRALQKARWPVARVIPEFAYSISALAQGCETQVLHLRALADMQGCLLQLRQRGRAQLHLRKIKVDDIVALTVVDASFAGEEGLKSQCGFFNLLADRKVNHGQALADMSEFHSSTISRVVRSTLAAASASLSTSLARQLYARLMAESLLSGEPSLHASWRMHLNMPGLLVTDAKSLFDHLTKTGSVPTERQTLIDLRVARDLAEHGSIHIKWRPSRHMLADCLTKATKVNEVFDKFMEHNKYSLVPSEEEAQSDKRRLSLRQGQRTRAKDRNKESKVIA